MNLNRLFVCSIHMPKKGKKANRQIFTLYGGRFMFSTQLLTVNYLIFLAYSSFLQAGSSQ